MNTPFSIIAAVDAQNGLGKNNTLVWRLPTDLKHFTEVTTQVKNPDNINAVIMGRKTWESLPQAHRPLKNRLNVVLSREKSLSLPDGVLLFASLDEALSQTSKNPKIENIFVIGGGKVYAEAVNHPDCQKIYLTHIHATFDCDTFFPHIDEKKFKLTEQSGPKTENGIEFEFAVYEK